MSKAKLCIVIAGATGVIGRACVQRLLADPDVIQVNVITRRPTGQKDAKLVEHVTDFDELRAYAAGHPALFNADAVLCCLGTTMRVAGSREAFEKVDYTYVKELAELASAKKVPRFLMVSAVGASPRAGAFYSRVKGRAEETVRALPFRCVHIMRPSLLLGERDERRPGEEAAKKFAPLLAPLLFGPLA